MTHSKINHIHVGRVWTNISLRISTERLNKQTMKALGLA